VIVLRILVVCACCLGVESAWDFAHADYLFRQDLPQSIRAALALEPDAWRYAVRLSQLDEDHASALLKAALALDPYNAQADIELGLRAEAAGDDTDAEKYLLAAFAIDRTYLPRWSLANYYLRHDKPLQFWMWARQAMQMPPQDASPLFELCWRLDPDPHRVSTAILSDNPEVLHQYLDFLVKRDQTSTLAPLAARLLRVGTAQTERVFLLSIVDRMVVANRAADALTLWRAMAARHWVIADSSLPNNGRFAREPVAVRFDWSIASTTGLHSWPGAAGLQTELTGAQPEQCILAEQTVPLQPGSYSLIYSYRTAGIPPGTGVHWQLIDAASGVAVAQSSDLSSDTTKEEVLPFAVSSQQSLFYLRLRYERNIGTSRVAGNLLMLSTRIQLRT